ncbi:MAG: PspC domain-containing protein [Pseudohongiella sp.]|nr:PspC domain-containing protein [Pseudohongiella sp.]MDP2285854.1 PspC domain-containing protein [Pseudohongiella sp.]
MSRNTDHEQPFSYQRPPLRLDRENKKVLGVCAGFAKYLEVPTALVRVIYVIACLVSPFLILVYLAMYWILEDEKRPGRIKEAMASYVPANNHASDDPASSEARMDTDTEAPQADASRRFDLKKPLYRSRSNVRVAGVCAGIADYLNVSTFIVRLVTFISIFILGGITFWAYIICWIVLDKEPKSLQKSHRGSAKTSGVRSTGTARTETVQQQAFDRVTIKDCAERLQATEQRLRGAEAFITSRQFRLHCEINRI